MRTLWRRGVEARTLAAVGLVVVGLAAASGRPSAEGGRLTSGGLVSLATGMLPGGAASAPGGGDPDAPLAMGAGGDGLGASARTTPDPEREAAGAASSTSGGDPGGATSAGAPSGAVARPRPAASSDPHRLATPGARPPSVEVLPPDSTPLAAAAGTEPGSLQPVDLLAGWESTVHRIVVGPMARSYLVVRPRRASLTPLPVVLVLHGRNLTPASIERLTGLWHATGPAIQVYPAGYGRSWDAGGCCGEAAAARIDDVTFLRDVVRGVLHAEHDADPTRVYAVGFSNGGRMAYRMACVDPGAFAGIVAVEAVPVEQCARTAPLPVLIVANRFDPLLTIPTGAPPKLVHDSVEPTVEAEVGDWRRLDGCSPTATVSTAGKLRITAFGRCAGAGRVAFAEYPYGGHTWSAGTPPTPSAEALAWTFLTGGPLGVPTPTA